MQKIPVTLSGFNDIKRELEDLKSNKRPQIINAIAEARAHGDLKENAEYHAAKEQQSFIEGRIKELEYKVASAQVIDISKIPNNHKVIFGVSVTIENQEKEQARYKIVGEDEANAKINKISINSPLAKALLGKEEGDDVQVKTPQGEVLYNIVKVEHL